MNAMHTPQHNAPIDNCATCALAAAKISHPDVVIHADPNHAQTPEGLSCFRVCGTLWDALDTGAKYIRRGAFGEWLVYSAVAASVRRD